MADEVITIDGSQGAGGGQILRTAVGLAAALGIEIRVVNIRAGRPRPGLGRQHMTSVRAAAAICRAEVAGDRIGSGELTFRPGRLQPGDYGFDVGTAGSTVLVLQTIIPALMLAEGNSQVVVTGGTHNPFAPCFEYLRDVFGVLAAAANLQAHFEMARAGFYPAGGGEVRMDVRGLGSAANVPPIRFPARGELNRIEGISAVSSTLPAHIAQRQAQQMLGRLANVGRTATIQQAVWDTASPGTIAFLRAVFTQSTAGFFCLGERGKSAERVADEVTSDFLSFLDSAGAVDCHAADQLVTIAALCSGKSHFLTDRVTDHLLTNVAVVRQLTGRNVAIEAPTGGPALVTIEAA